MNTDEDQLNVRHKGTGRVVCIIAAVFVVLPCLGLHWLRAPGELDLGMSLWSLEMCGHERGRPDVDESVAGPCRSLSNFTIARMMREPASERFELAGEDVLASQVAWQLRETNEAIGAFSYAGLATLVASVLAALALGAAGGLAYKDRFIRSPIALTTAAVLLLCLALLTACVFVAGKPHGLPLGVSWPFFVHAGGIVAGISGAQMLSKAFAAPVDTYWDGIDPEPPVQL